MTRANDWMNPIREALKATWGQVVTGANPGNRYSRWALVFVTPYFSKRFAEDKRRVTSRIAEVIRLTASALPRSPIAWAFPNDKRSLASKKREGRVYPSSSMLVLAKLPKRVGRR